MMKQEFIQLLNEKTNDSRQDFPDDQYQVIEKVYMFHPSIKDKQAIVDLYWQFGISVIKDMLPRAEALEELEKEIHKHQMAIEELARKVKDLS